MDRSMRFSLRFALIATFILAVLVAIIAPALRPQPRYEALFGGNSTSWFKAEVRSSSLFRGPGIPTVLIGEATSKYVPDLDGWKLPFVVILDSSRYKKIDFQSTLSNEALDMSVTDKIQIGDTSITLIYSLSPNDDDSEITERMVIDGKDIDLTKGRLIELINQDGSYSLRQSIPRILDRTILPNQPASTRENMMPIIEWWQQVQQDAGDNK